MAANIGDQRGPEWAGQYALGSGGAREGALEPPAHENPEWEKARQALASISKAAAAGGKGTAGGGAQYSSSQGDPNLQQPPYYQWYQPYGSYYPYGYYYPMGVYSGYGATTTPTTATYGAGGGYAAAPQQPPQQSGLGQQPPVPGLDEAPPYGSPQPQLPPNPPPQPPPPHSTLPMGGGAAAAPAGGGAGGGSGTPQAAAVPPPYPPHGYSSDGPGPKGKKGQLWSRMKQAPGSGGLKFQLPKRPFVLSGSGFAPPPEQQQQQQQRGAPPAPPAAAFAPQPGPDKHHGHGGKPEDWPQDMKEYVQRCFTACESEEDKDRTEKLLKEVLQARLQDGSAFTIDWSREPLPG